MGRKTKWENETHTIEDKLIEIISTAENNGLKFGDIVLSAKNEGISRPSVARHLRSLVRNGTVKKNNGKYQLAMEAINGKHAQRSLFSVLSMHLFDDVFEKAGQGTLNDQDFIEQFTRRVGILALYTILTGLEKASNKEFKEAGRWIEESFGTLIQKDGWRMCVDRQVYKEVVNLKTKIKLQQPITPIIEVKNDAIYVHTSQAIQVGMASRVLKELSKSIPMDRLKLLKACLKNLYPEETELLDNIINLIKTAEAQSKRR